MSIRLRIDTKKEMKKKIKFDQRKIDKQFFSYITHNLPASSPQT